MVDKIYERGKLGRNLNSGLVSLISHNTVIEIDNGQYKPSHAVYLKKDEKSFVFINKNNIREIIIIDNINSELLSFKGYLHPPKPNEMPTKNNKDE